MAPISDFWSTQGVLWLVIIVCAFCLIFFLVSSYIVLKSGEGLSDRYFKLTTVTIIISLATLLTVAGFSAQQSNAALGLLGTVAGYLLGKNNSNKNGKDRGDDDA